MTREHGPLLECIGAAALYCAAGLIALVCVAVICVLAVG